jgi:ribosomal protein S18 acetylase RimI-like enzyme
MVRDAGGSTPARADLETRPGHPGDAPTYERDIGTDTAATFVRRLARDEGCYLVLEDRRIVHATWIATTATWTRELQRYVSPPPGDAYVYESYTVPRARGRGLYPLALQAIGAHLDGTAARVWVGVENDNLASLRAVTKAGFEAAVAVSYSRLLGHVTVGPTEELRPGAQPTIAVQEPRARGGASEASAP